MKKVTLSDLSNMDNWENAVVVFTEDSFDKPYTLEQRSYKISREDGKYFKKGMIGNSLYGDCLDGKDLGVRLDWYLGDWHIDYCYITE